MDHYKSLIENFGTLGPKMYNSINYITNNYSDAPPIQNIVPKQLEFFDAENTIFIEQLTNDYKQNTLVEFIISSIKTIHQKEDPSEQSIWSTDANRSNYIIKELLENKNSYWTIDKKGIKSGEYLVKPILDFIKKEIIKYNNNAYEMIRDTSNVRKEIIMETQKCSSELLTDIEDGKLCTDIIKKLSHHFFHKQSKNNLSIEDVD